MEVSRGVEVKGMVKRKREVSKIIKRGIINKGMSMQEAAKKMGISKQLMYYVMTEKGDRNWDEWEVEKWCKVLGLREEVIKGVWKKSREDEIMKES